MIILSSKQFGIATPSARNDEGNKKSIATSKAIAMTILFFTMTEN
jgi:hypothetical protein